LKFSKLYALILISTFFSSISIFGAIQVAQACGDGWWQEPCNRGIIITPTPRQIDSQAKKEADAILAEKRAKRKVEDDAINKANAETLARQEAEEIAAREAADNIKRQEAEEKLANQQRDEKERNDKERELNDKRNSALIQSGGNLFKAIFNIK
jgi:hypothetical protein